MNKKLKTLLPIFLFLFIVMLSDNAVASSKYYYDAAWHLHSEDVAIILNNEEVNFDVPALIVDSRTLVPVRSFFEKAGAKVDWNEETREVTVSGNGFSVKLQIDSKIALVNGENKTMDVPAKIVTSAANVGRTLVPLRFISENLGYHVNWDGNTSTVIVKTVGEISVKNIYASTNIDELKELPSVKITKIKNYTSGFNDIIEVYADSTATDPGVSVLTSPDRLIFDFKGLDAGIIDGRTDKSGVSVSNVRYANHSGDFFRVVADLNSQASYKIEKASGYYKITISGISYKNISLYNVEGYYLSIADRGKVTLISSDDNNYIYSFKISSTNLGSGTINSNDLYIKSIVIAKNTSDTTIVFNAKCKLIFDISYGVSSSKIAYKRSAVTVNSSTTINNELSNTVVIDAGHGGRDPGAVGYNGDTIDLFEKDINLDIAQMTYQILKNSGVNAILTRNGDEYVSLTDRASIANNANADLFVSVHVNSIVSDEPNGTAVYYYDDAIYKATKSEAEQAEYVSKKDESRLTSKQLASILQDCLINAMGTKDRGISDGSRFVVNNQTYMPAVIVETAFISNKNDKALLKEPAFRTKIASALADGIIKALNQMN